MATRTNDDAQLLSSLRSEDAEAAFAQIVERHVDLVYGTALRRVGGDRHLAEDVAQRVFADLARKAPRLDCETMLAGWLYRAARFAAAQAVRTEQRRKTREREAHTMHEIDTGDTIAWEQLRPVIDDALEELNPLEREVILLRFFENQALADVGARFSISADAARMRLERALEKLGGLLARRGIASTSTALAATLGAQAHVAAPLGLAATVLANATGSVGFASAVGAGIAKTTSLTLGKVIATTVVGGIIAGAVAYQVLLPERTSDATPTKASSPKTLASSSPSFVATPTGAAAPMRATTARAATSSLDRNVEAALERLDRLVGLNADQRRRAADVFAAEQRALAEFPSAQERLENGIAVRQNTRAQIRALLSPPQQEIYDRSPQRIGGAAAQDPAALPSRIDKVVTLSDEQTLAVTALCQRQIEALQALTPEARAGPEGALIRRATRAQIRALLTPEQRQKFDANPNGAEDLEQRANAVAFIKTSPAIAARFGPITHVSLAHATLRTAVADEQVQAMHGSHTFRVQGPGGADAITVYWRKRSSDAASEIIRAETKSGETISR